MSSKLFRVLSMISFIAGFASIFGSIAIWFYYESGDRAHAERFGIFVGLWAPTFLILSSWLRVRADSLLAK